MILRVVSGPETIFRVPTDNPQKKTVRTDKMEE